ncbi:uncharacterized protein CDAR_110701 [Caerostris darwini]|uniref:Secreted protein n=1 Tax=Caerostris darwini TaxID=1538125 RepID=A0AAV4SA31_9ARAC|nr:uncharacterized protein CDAR_110701 [Caerostris darwini]
MSHSAFYFGIILSTIFTLTVSASCLHYLSCPCGSGNKNFTHCIDEVPNKKNPCEIWANCESCESNVTRCITCPQNRRGPICSEVVEGHTRTKRQYPTMEIDMNHPFQSYGCPRLESPDLGSISCRQSGNYR